MLIWKAKIGGTYTNMKTPSSYKIDYEDLDKNSYRSVVSGNLIDNVISKKWSKIAMSYNYLTADEVNTITNAINQNPVIIQATNPLYSTNNTPSKEMEMRCSKISLEMNENKAYTMSFNLVQKKKVSGQ